MDKKYLLGSTSLVAASVLAGGSALADAHSKPNLQLGGFYAFDTHLFDQDEQGTADFSSIMTAQDAEVNIKMRGELDNGMKIGGRIELEASNGGDQIDQSWLTLEAGWGRIDVGAINSGRYNLSWTVNAPNVAHGISSGVQTEWLTHNGGTATFAFRRPLGSANVDASNDDQGIHYYSPRFNGFKIALSYRPSVSTTQGSGSGGSNLGEVDQTSNYHDAFDLGVQYTGSFGDVGLTALMGYATASAPTVAKNGVANGGTFTFDDYTSTNMGFRISTSGFKVGGMIADVSDGFCVDGGDADCADTTDRSSEGTAYTFGASYGSGPWAVSAQVHNGEVEDSVGNTQDTEMDVWSIGAKYTLGPGVNLIASYQDAEITNEDNVAANGNKGDSLSVGVKVSF